MMNKCFRLFGIILVFALVFTGCPADTSTATEYTVIFDANGGTVSPSSIKVDSSKTIAQLPVPEKTSGSTNFWGWYTKNGDINSDWGSPFTTATPVTADITVYARWEYSTVPDMHTITFNAAGGTVSPASKQVLSEEPAGELPVPSRQNYTFSGWYTAQGGGGTLFTSNTIVTGDITVYAKWTEGAPGGNEETNIGSSVHLGDTISIKNMQVYSYVYSYESGDWQWNLTAMNNAEPVELNLPEYGEYAPLFNFDSAMPLPLMITWGKINIEIPVPAADSLGPIDSDSYLTSSNSSARGFVLHSFIHYEYYDYEDNYGWGNRFYLYFRNKNDFNYYAAFIYVDRDTVITGIGASKYWECSLKQGWNSVIVNGQDGTVKTGIPDENYVWVLGNEGDSDIYPFKVAGRPYIDGRGAKTLEGTISTTVDGVPPAGGYDIVILENDWGNTIMEIISATGSTWSITIPTAYQFGYDRYFYFYVIIYPDADRKNYFTRYPDISSYLHQYDETTQTLSDIVLSVRPINTRQMTVNVSNLGTVEAKIIPYHFYLYEGSENGMFISGNGTITMKTEQYSDDFCWFRVVTDTNTYVTKGRIDTSSTVNLDISQMFLLE